MKYIGSFENTRGLLSKTEFEFYQTDKGAPYYSINNLTNDIRDIGYFIFDFPTTKSRKEKNTVFDFPVVIYDKLFYGKLDKEVLVPVTVKIYKPETQEEERLLDELLLTFINNEHVK